MTDRMAELNRLSACSFVLYDLALFLDTHPDDADALAAFQEARERRKQAQKSYEEKFGPLMLDCCEDKNHWSFADGPAPWEGGNL